LFASNHNMAAQFFLKFRIAENYMHKRRRQISSKTETNITSNGNCLFQVDSKLLTEKLMLFSNVIEILKILINCSEFLGRDADALSP
jgi:hypothetical protein